MGRREEIIEAIESVESTVCEGAADFAINMCWHLNDAQLIEMLRSVTSVLGARITGIPWESPEQVLGQQWGDQWIAGMREAMQAHIRSITDPRAMEEDDE